MKFSVATFGAALTLGLFAGSLTADARQPGTVYRIGMLETRSAELNAANIDAFRRGLRELGYSLSGFPEPKSALFQRTLGAAAFAVFSWRGRMSHDLGEPIAGAPTLDRSADAASAAAQLRRSIQDFRNSKEPLRPRFAYGALTKAEYEHAHAMHLANHFSAFSIKA